MINGTVLLLIFLSLYLIFKHSDKIDPKGPKMSRFQKAVAAGSIILFFSAGPDYYHYVWGDQKWNNLTGAETFWIAQIIWVGLPIILIVSELEYFNWRWIKIQLIVMLIIIVIPIIFQKQIRDFFESDEREQEKMTKEMEERRKNRGLSENNPLGIYFSETLTLSPESDRWVMVLPQDICYKEHILLGKLATNERFKNKKLHYFKALQTETQIAFKVICKDGKHEKDCPNGYHSPPQIQTATPDNSSSNSQTYSNERTDQKPFSSKSFAWLPPKTKDAEFVYFEIKALDDKEMKGVLFTSHGPIYYEVYRDVSPFGIVLMKSDFIPKAMASINVADSVQYDLGLSIKFWSKGNAPVKLEWDDDRRFKVTNDPLGGGKYPIYK